MLYGTQFWQKLQKERERGGKKKRRNKVKRCNSSTMLLHLFTSTFTLCQRYLYRAGLYE